MIRSIGENTLHRQIRAGDTVTWKINSDEPHSATFLSGSAPPPNPIPISGGGPTDIMLNPVIDFPSRAPNEAYSQVIFHPGQPAPEFIVPTPVEGQELPNLVISPEVAFPVIPSGEYDGSVFFSSGLIGTLDGPLPGGTTFAMTFNCGRIDLWLNKKLGNSKKIIRQFLWCVVRGA